MKIWLVLGAHAQKFPWLVKNCDQEPPLAFLMHIEMRILYASKMHILDALKRI